MAKKKAAGKRARASRSAKAAVKAPADRAKAAVKAPADRAKAAVKAPAERAKAVARGPRRAARSLTGKRLSKAAIDLMIGALPGEVVRDVAQVSAPLARYGGASNVSAALLSRSLQILAQPPAAGAVSNAMTLSEIAQQVSRSRQALTGWASAGLLGSPRRAGRAKRWGRDALERARLVDYLLRHGAASDELFEAAATDQLALLVLERSIGRQPNNTREEAAVLTGLAPELLARFTRALGAAPGEEGEPVYTDREMEALRLLGALRAVYSDDDLVEVASVVGRAMHEIAEAFLELFRRRFTRPFADAGASELEMMLRLATVIELTVPTTGPLLEMILRRQLQASALAETILEVEHKAGGLDGQVQQAVGFPLRPGFWRPAS